jgi:hypothetical protein
MLAELLVSENTALDMSAVAATGFRTLPHQDRCDCNFGNVVHTRVSNSIIVNGVETFATDECTGATSGQLLRYGRG